MRRALFALTGLAAMLLGTPGARAADYWMYVGTYTAGASKGIYAWRWDPGTAKLTPAGLAAETTNPSFLAAHPNGRFLYAVNETNRFERMKASGSVSAFAINPATAKLKLLNAVPSRGAGPCHLSLDSEGRCVLVANYESGTVAAFALSKDGFLNQSQSYFQHEGTVALPKRQGGPHAHCILPSPDNRFVLAADLGLDEVLIYRLDAGHASLARNDPPSVSVAPGSGPRHLAFHPNGRVVYLINEIASTVTAFAYDSATGSLRVLQTVSTLPKDFKGENNCAEIQVHPSGKFLYGSNRGHDSIAVFAIDPSSGKLTAIEHVSTQGKEPRNFAIDPSGGYLFAANQNSNTIVLFRINPVTGRLVSTGQVLSVGAPVCVTFVPIK